MKKNCVIICLLSFYCTIFLSHFAEGSPEQPELLREILLDENINVPLKREIGTHCSDALIEHYSQGKTLENKTVKRFLIPLDSPASQNCSNKTRIPLYHYTSSKFVVENFSDLNQRNYSDLISYGRKKEHKLPMISLDGVANAIKGVLYVSMYPDTSTGYGDHLLTFWADKSLKVVPRSLFSHFYQYGMTMYSSPLLKKIVNELPSDIRKKCDVSRIALFILEDSGADLVDYIPSQITNDTKYNQNGWFYLLNSKSIRSHQLVSFSKIGIENDEVAEELNRQGRSCELPK